MRTCQPHLSISWNFPPPFLFNIVFPLDTHTANFTMGVFTRSRLQIPTGQPATLWEDPTAAWLHRFQGFCSGQERIITPYQTLIAPKIPSPFWHAIWLQGRADITPCSGNHQWNVRSWEGKSSAHSWPQARRTSDYCRRKRSWNPTQQSGCKQPPVFKGWKQNLDDQDIQRSSTVSWLGCHMDSLGIKRETQHMLLISSCIR